MPLRQILNIALTVICAAVLLAVTVWLILKWGQIPDRVPTNYGLNGEVTVYGEKTSLLIPHVINWVCCILLTWMSFRPIEKGGAVSFARMHGVRIGNMGTGNLTRKAFAKNPAATNNVAIDMIMGMKLTLTVLLAYLTMESAKGTPQGAWVMPVFMVVIFVPVVIHLIRFVRIAKS